MKIFTFQELILSLHGEFEQQKNISYYISKFFLCTVKVHYLLIVESSFINNNSNVEKSNANNE